MVELLPYMQAVVGSNPTGTTIWPVRLSVRSSGFHPGKRGSTPLRATKKRFGRLKYSTYLCKILIVVFPTQRMSTIQGGIRIHHPLPRPCKTQEAVKIGARRVLHHYRRHCVVPVR